jgi:hypothetical protein
MAEPESNLFRSLDNYLERVLDVLANWADWLGEHERRVLAGAMDELGQHAGEATQLHLDLSQLSERRAAVLAAARAQGVICSTLKQLAQSLPEWQTQPEFRLRIKNVERSMTRLRRLNTAAWLLVHQCAKVVDETMLIMTSGQAKASVYGTTPHADTLGGQFLDENI